MSHLYITAAAGAIDISGGDHQVASLQQVPAGSYFITAKVTLFNADRDDQDAHCTLSTGDLSETRLGPNPDDGEQVITLHDSATFSSPTDIVLTCNTFSGAALDIKLAALAVGGIN